MSTLYYDAFESPIGLLTAVVNATGALTHILFPNHVHATKGREHWQHAPMAVAQPRSQILEYLQGQRTEFELTLAPHGSPFQLQVWHALTQIPFGQTWSYAQLARHLDRPKACRAVGAANGRNPLPIVLPCHRVIGSNGTLTGFAGGLAIKAALLQLEGQPKR